MHDIWNPWHGCIKCSEGCEHCYMYSLDKQRDKDGSEIYKVKSNFDYPIQRKRDGSFKIQSGESIRVCLTSDFFLKEADEWREEAWEFMRERKDVIFHLLTKRPERVLDNLPSDWGRNGWDNIELSVTAENQKRADERIPILLALPFKHKGLMCAPLISYINIDKYLETGQINAVLCGGENYEGCRPCYYDWVKALSDACKKYKVTFVFYETGTRFIKDNKEYYIPDKKKQTIEAYKTKLSYLGRDPIFKLYDNFGLELKESELYIPQYTGIYCNTCASRITCNGCSNCGKCKQI